MTFLGHSMFTSFTFRVHFWCRKRYRKNFSFFTGRLTTVEQKLPFMVSRS